MNWRVRLSILVLAVAACGCFGENTTRQLKQDEVGKSAVKSSKTEKDTTPFMSTQGNNSPINLTTDQLERLINALEAKRESKVEASSWWDISVSEFWQKVSGWFYLIVAVAFFIFVVTAIAGVVALRLWLKNSALAPLITLAKSAANGLAYATVNTAEWKVWDKFKDKVHREIINRGGVPPT